MEWQWIYWGKLLVGVAYRNAQTTPVLTSCAAMADRVKSLTAPRHCVSVHLVLLAQLVTLVNSTSIFSPSFDFLSCSQL